VAAWFWYAVVAAVLYGAHQIFTKMAADHIGEGLGGFLVEATAAVSILAYICIPLVGEPVGSKIERKRNYLFCAYWYLRRRRNHCIFSALPKRRSTFLSSCHSGRRRANHGRRWYLVFSRSSILAPNRRYCVCHHRFVFAPQMNHSI